MQDKIEVLEEQRDQEVLTIGRKTVHKEVLIAELLQHCQKVVNLNNEIAKAKQYATSAPRVVEP